MTVHVRALAQLRLVVPTRKVVVGSLVPMYLYGQVGLVFLLRLLLILMIPYPATGRRHDCVQL